MNTASYIPLSFDNKIDHENTIFSYETRGKSRSLAKKKVSDKTVENRSHRSQISWDDSAPAGVLRRALSRSSPPLRPFPRSPKWNARICRNRIASSELVKCCVRRRRRRRHRRMCRNDTRDIPADPHTTAVHARLTYTYTRTLQRYPSVRSKWRRIARLSRSRVRAILRAPFALIARNRTWRKFAKYVNCLITSPRSRLHCKSDRASISGRPIATSDSLPAAQCSILSRKSWREEKIEISRCRSSTSGVQRLRKMDIALGCRAPFVRNKQIVCVFAGGLREM